MSAFWLSHTIESTTKELNWALKGPFQFLEQICDQYQISNKNIAKPFLVVDNLAADFLFFTIYFEEHLLAILPEEWKFSVPKSNPIAIVEEETIPANAVII